MKKAVLLSFRINDNQIIDGAETKYYDKVALKFADYTEERFAQEGFRVYLLQPYVKGHIFLKTVY